MSEVAPSLPGAGGLASASVLMLDDDPTMRAAVRAMLRAAGCGDIMQTGNGHEALSWVQARKPDLILCDCQMAAMDGMTFLRRLREMPEGVDIPVLMVTVNQNAADAWEARQLKVAGWLAKPVSAQNVVAQVAATLGRLPPRVRENVLDELVARYEEQLPQHVLALQTLGNDLRVESPTLAAELGELHRRLHTVKGQAGTMGYALLGQLAALLHDLLALALENPQRAAPLAPELLKIIRVGLAGMKLVADRRLRGDGGAAGIRMRQQLGAFTDDLRHKLGAA